MPPARSARTCGVAGVAALLVLAFFALNRFTAHFDETILLLMPPVLGAVLWTGWPRVRRIKWWIS